MKKGVWLGIVITTVLAGIVTLNIWWVNAKEKPKVEVTTMEEVEMSDSFMTKGTLKLAERQDLYHTTQKGRIAEIYVNKGDKVEQGTPLLRYEDSSLRHEKEQVELQLESETLRLNNLQEKHKNIDKKVEKDKDNVMLQAEHDQIKLEQLLAEIELERVKLQLDSINEQIMNLEVTSDIEGSIIEVNNRTYSSHQEQHPLIQIGSLDQMIIEGFISEYNIMEIEEGQTVNLTTEALPNRSWTGIVKTVSDSPRNTNDLDNGNTTVEYPFTVSVSNELSLNPGFPIIVEIIKDEYMANTLPLSAVYQDEEVNYVFAVENGAVKRRDIVTGSVTTETIQILEGISKDEQVILDKADDLKTGVEVTIQ